MTNFVCLTIRFKTPLAPYVLDGTINGQLNGQLNDSQKATFEYIVLHQGCNTTAIAKGLGKPFRTIDKHVRVLLELRCIERRGGKKLGGYYPL